MTSVHDDFAHAVDIVDHTWIPMADGTRLSAKLWLPRAAEPVPALLEYLPYRKDDFTRERDEAQHCYFAGHGYATARVDIRGTGDSEGILEDEYLQSEIDDGVRVIEWLARQPWCNGRVGMFGISWGGFNSLQVAAVAPPALQAVIAVAATEDRYGLDVHYLGGAVLASEMLPWAATMLVRNAIPPTPRIVGPTWKQQWLHRLEETPRFVESWLRHQRRDGYWRHGSVGEDHRDIRCPVFIVGGLADGYADTVLRLAAGLGSGARALLGPWSHNFPQCGVPGPTIGFLQEALRWWDHWLRGADTGIIAEKPVRIWLQDWVSPASSYETRPGRWITEPGWPPAAATPQQLWIGATRLDPSPPSPGIVRIAAAQTHGIYGGRWWGYGLEGDLPDDQRLEDAGAASFDSEPLTAPRDVVGFPEVRLRLETQHPNGIVAVQLSDVAADGRALQVARGVLNLSHRNGHETPQPMPPGEPVELTVVMSATAHRIEPGHRWRLTISPTYWPLVWPTAPAGPLLLHCGKTSRLRLPERRPQPESAVAPFEPPEQAPTSIRRLSPPRRTRRVTTGSGITTVVDRDDSGEFEYPGEVAASLSATDRFAIAAADPLTAEVVCDRHCRVRWPESTIEITTRSEMRSTVDRWHVVNSIEARADGDICFAQNWDFRVERDWT